MVVRRFIRAAKVTKILPTAMGPEGRSRPCRKPREKLFNTFCKTLKILALTVRFLCRKSAKNFQENDWISFIFTIFAVPKTAIELRRMLIIRVLG
jgi:hypothetical protein